MSDVITLLTAPAGSGKTYSRVRRLVEEVLPHSEITYWSNLPLNAEVIAEFVAAATQRPADEFLKRIRFIPEVATDRWRTGESGPWEFFSTIDLQTCEVALDECHEYCNRNSSRTVRREWQKFLGQVRHRGCKVELITQHVKKLATEIEQEAGVRVELANVETARDPFFRIRLSDWYELRAAWLTGEYTACVWEVERRQVDGEWRESDSRRFKLEPAYFGLYDSYSLPETGGVKAEAPQREYEKRSRLGVTWWVFRRNWHRIVRSLAIVAAVVGSPFWGPVAIKQGMAYVSSHMHVAGQAKSDPSAGPGVEVNRVVNNSSLARTDSLLGELAAAKAEVARGFAVRGLVGDDVVFANGEVVTVGSAVHGGIYDGKVVRAIDWKRRAAVLDDGTELFMGDGLPDDRAVAASGRRAGIQSGVLGSSGGSTRGVPVVGVRPIQSNSVSDGDAAGSIQQAPGGSLPLLNSVGRKIR